MVPLVFGHGPPQTFGSVSKLVLAVGPLPARVEIASLPDRHQVDVGVSDAEALDGDARARCSGRASDRTGELAHAGEEARVGIGGQVEHRIDVSARHDRDVTGRDRVAVEESDELVIGPDDVRR